MEGLAIHYHTLRSETSSTILLNCHASISKPLRRSRPTRSCGHKGGHKGTPANLSVARVSYPQISVIVGHRSMEIEKEWPRSSQQRLVKPGQQGIGKDRRSSLP